MDRWIPPLGRVGSVGGSCGEGPRFESCDCHLEMCNGGGPFWANYRIGYAILSGLGSANRLAGPGHGAVISDSRIDGIEKRPRNPYKP